MLKNDLLLRTLKGENVERAPIWLMRQAGRILPEYRAIRSSVSGFIELVSTPDLAAEVTIQPIDRLGVDAAIIFSDILVIPECMGLPYEMIEKKGPFFPRTIESKSDIDQLNFGASAAQELKYVFDAVSLTKKELDNRVPLIVFSGAPWTLFSYMIEGQGSKTFSKAKRMLYKEPELSHALLSKITDTIIAYLDLKVEAGGDVIQLFDSWAGILNKELYDEFCIPYIKKIREHFRGKRPFIFFARGAYFALDSCISLDADAYSVDWTMSPKVARQTYGEGIILQGNLDPVALYATKEKIEEKAHNVLSGFGRNHIFNLGHGVYPDTPLENVQHLVSWVKNQTYSNS